MSYILSDELRVNSDQLTQASDEWIVKASNLVYDVYGAATTVASAVAALGLKSMSFQDPRNVQIEGGYGVFDVLRVDKAPVEPTDAVPLAFARSALFTSGLPFTDAGDLLVYKSPGSPYIVHRGNPGQVFRRTLRWVNPPSVGGGGAVLPPNVIGVPYTVAVGPIEHPASHDEWFPTVAEFSAWAANKYLLATLTILPNGFAATATGDFVMPTMPEGATVIFGQPVDYTPVNGVPGARLKLVARGATIASARLSLFEEFDVIDSLIEVGELHIRFRQTGVERLLFGYGCKAEVGTLYLQPGDAVTDAIWNVRGTELDVQKFDFSQLPSTHTHRLRLHDSDASVLYMAEGGAPNRSLEVDLINSTLLVRRPLQGNSASRWRLNSLNSSVQLAGGIWGE